MVDLDEKLLMKEKELKEIIEKLQSRIPNYPKGSLKIAQNKSGNSYYHCFGEEPQNKGSKRPFYIKKKEIELIKALAQKSYDKKVLRWAKECHDRLTDFMECYQDSVMDDFYENMSISRKELVEPLEDTRQGIIKRWNSIEYERKGFLEEGPYIITEKGERVRSKSEKILADKFFGENIPYKYELPLRLNGYGVVYPDFTLLNAHTGKIYYWEHLGLMDNPEYAERTQRKIETYVKNGIFLGKQLILTFETKKYGLNIQMVEALIKEYCL